ncbi:unnamed protein product [Parnassius apollo]|uniref:(apollo) hypothetical protein n=1 Tax=Parnassius apollo TaxID=110799 RepID=A0A8S3XCM8_PARAO|nr:unnamed protein product [Parnassius apollo]
MATGKSRDPFVLDERFVCNIKRSCVECLRLSHCSWCETESKCYCKQLPTFQDYCKNATIDYKDYEFSLEENAECSCGGVIKNNCYPPEVTDEVCSGRGNCVCGRCICNPVPDPEHPTKNIVGEYCEFDNFSCDGPHCNEGPYPLSQTKTTEDNLNEAEEVEQPSQA